MKKKPTHPWRNDRIGKEIKNSEAHRKAIAAVKRRAKAMSKTMTSQIAVLCVAKNSVYKKMPGVDAYDIDRDARTFPGGIPVVAHPPCRCFSAFCRHQAKPDDRESEIALGVWCVEQVRQWGGVVEQPAHSKLWEQCKLPIPSKNWYYNSPEVGFSIEVSQFWWGDSREKATWLWFSGIPSGELPTIPLRLKPEGGDRRIWQLMSSKNQREKTPIQFAEWLVAAARKVSPADVSTRQTLK